MKIIGEKSSSKFNRQLERVVERLFSNNDAAMDKARCHTGSAFRHFVARKGSTARPSSIIMSPRFENWATKYRTRLKNVNKRTLGPVLEPSVCFFIISLACDSRNKPKKHTSRPRTRRLCPFVYVFVLIAKMCCPSSTLYK